MPRFDFRAILHAARAARSMSRNQSERARGARGAHNFAVEFMLANKERKNVCQISFGGGNSYVIASHSEADGGGAVTKANS